MKVKQKEKHESEKLNDLESKHFNTSYINKENKANVNRQAKINKTNDVINMLTQVKSIYIFFTLFN